MVQSKLALMGLMSAAVLAGCAGLDDGSSLHGKHLRSVDGLDRVDLPLAGTLELRKDHGIGGYDKLMVPAATISFVRGSERLTTPARRTFLKMVRSSLVDAIAAADLPVVDQPGHCVMEVELAAIGMDLSTERRAGRLASFTMVMQFRDSESGEPLLRYSTKRLIESPEEGVTHDAKLRKGLDEVVRDLNIAASLRGAGLADDAVRPGCDSTLAQLGRQALSGR